MTKYQKIAFIFPGQGSQYVGMGKDFFENNQTVRETFEEGNDTLQRNISKLILEGPEEELVRTSESQPAIYLLSIALTRLLRQQFAGIQPGFAAGLSLGEYSALATSGYFHEMQGLSLVAKRGQLMGEACSLNKGTMAAILGLNQNEVEHLVQEAQLPHDLWAANFNSPNQTVISGTLKGIEKGSELALKMGAKKVIPLSVEGAFHSGLMQSAQEKLRESIEMMPFLETPTKIVMNASGNMPHDVAMMKELLISQVTKPVRWSESIIALEKSGVDLFVEIGCGRTLAALNKRIGVKVPTLTLEKLDDLDTISKELTA